MAGLHEDLTVAVGTVNNPLTPLVRAYQDALLWHAAPDAASLLRPLAAGVCMALLAWLLFRRASSQLVDAL